MHDRRSRATHAIVLSFVLAVAARPEAQAQSLKPFCAAAAKPVQADGLLSQTVRAVFGPIAFSSAAGKCVYHSKSCGTPQPTYCSRRAMCQAQRATGAAHTCRPTCYGGLETR